MIRIEPQINAIPINPIQINFTQNSGDSEWPI
jgi:hypothetical protein